MALRTFLAGMTLLAIAASAPAQEPPEVDEEAFAAWRADCLAQRRSDCDSVEAFLAETRPRDSDVRVRPRWKPKPFPPPVAPPPEPAPVPEPPRTNSR
jgi:hypothetical protein